MMAFVCFYITSIPCREKYSILVRGTTDWNCPSWPGTIVTTYMSYLTTGGPGKEHGTNKLLPTRKFWERSKGERRCQATCLTNFPDSFLLESILAEWCASHQEGPWTRMTGQRQPRNQPCYHKTQDWEPLGRVVLLGSLTLQLPPPPSPDVPYQ